MHYHIFRSTTRLQTFLLHSIHCKHQFRILEYIIFVTQTNHVCGFITLNYTSMTHCVGIYLGTVAFYRDLTRITVSDIKSEWIGYHSTRNSIRKNDTGLTGTVPYHIFRSTTRLQTVLLHSIHCKHQFRILQYIIFVTQTNHVCDFITLNYTSTTHCVGIY